MPDIAAVDALAQLTFQVQGLLEQRAAEHGTSLPQVRLLGVLRDRRPSMQQLAALLGLDKSSVTGLVDRAERRGLVSRVPSDTDRRSVLVELTDAGREIVTDAATAFAHDVEALLSHLPAGDRRALVGLMSRLLIAEADARGVDLTA